MHRVKAHAEERKPSLTSCFDEGLPSVFFQKRISYDDLPFPPSVAVSAQIWLKTGKDKHVCYPVGFKKT